MDIKFLHNSIDALKIAGSSINEDIVPVLYSSLIQLQSENHFDAIYLWGHIETLSDDYYIAYGYQKDPIKNKIFFYTQNIFEWYLMPTDWLIIEFDKALKIKTQFNGNPRYIETTNKLSTNLKEKNEFSPKKSIILTDEYLDEEEHKEDIKYMGSVIFDTLSEVEETWQTKMEVNVVDTFDLDNMIKEENRLAITVKMIDNESHIVPRGYFYKLPDETIVKAPYFKGLDYSEIGDEKNFLHINHQYQPLENSKNKVRFDYNHSIDFLEGIDKDIPKGCWVSRIEFNRYLIYYNLLWPGAVFFQDMNTGVHGFFYNGNGVKNLDLPFMI